MRGDQTVDDASIADASAPELRLLIQRWTEGARRLGLDAEETQAVSVLLVLDLDPGMRHTVLRGATSTRVRDLAALVSTGELARTLPVLARLEERRLLATSGLELDWPERHVSLSSVVRAFVLARPHSVPVARPLITRVSRTIDRVAAACRDAERSLVIVRGRRGSGRDGAVASLLAALGVAPYTLTARELRVDRDALEPRLSARIAVWDARGVDPSPEDLDLARHFCMRASVAIAVLDAHTDAPDVDDATTLVVETDARDEDERAEAWRIALAPRVAKGGLDAARASAIATRLARRSRMGAGLAWRALAASMIHDDDDAWVADIEACGRQLLPRSSERGAMSSQPAVSLEDLVLSEDTARSLADLLVLAEDRLARGETGRRGVKAMFVGPSGTGKTMAAMALATRLRMPLSRVDLAQVTSKWVGETEKNLRAALDHAEAAGALLLFDEGDALFGKRGTVQSGADRYANNEASFLLQAIEAFDGIAILTTNLRANIDAAYTRRFDVTVSFRMPGHEALEALWRAELGPEGEELPSTLIAQLARALPLSGGDVAAVARLARAHAGRERGGIVSEAHLRRAIQAQLEKQGSALSARDFWSRSAFEP